MVSGKKNRYRDENYNQDLTYICPRIIAMSYPAEGLATNWRNKLTDVCKFLNERHGSQFLVLNLSCQKYSYEKYNNFENVKEFQWVDHHSPFQPYLVEVVLNIQDQFLKDINFVCVVHCMAGKGRTGTTIGSFQLSTGLFSSYRDALGYYGKKRYVSVTQPAQRRYVEYFDKLINSDLSIWPKQPTIKRVTKFRFIHIPKFSGESCKPQIEAIDVYKNVKIFSEKYIDLNSYIKHVAEKDNKETIKIAEIHVNNFYVFGDIEINVQHQNSWSTSKMFRLAFNTMFIENNEITYGLKQLDPDKTRKDPRFPTGFEFSISFEDVANPNEAIQDMKEFNEVCAKQEQMFQQIKLMQERIANTSEIDKQVMMFNDPTFDDRMEIAVEVGDDEDDESDVSEGDD